MTASGLSKYQLNEQAITEHAFLCYYLDISCTLPLEKENYFLQMLSQSWGIKNTNETANTCGEDFVDARRVQELENTVFEKIRQKTHGAQNEGRTVNKIFKHYDKEGYGCVSLKEFKQALGTLGCYFSENEHKALFNKFDVHNKSKVDYEEFAGFFAVKGVGKYDATPSQFKMSRDPPHDTLAKIRTALRAKGLNGVRSLIMLFKKFDANGDERLDRNEV